MASSSSSQSHLLYTTLTLNSTTLFTSESPLLAQLQLFSLPEHIAGQMAIINTSSTALGQIPLEVNGVNVVVMYVKEVVQGDFVTVVTCVDSTTGRILPITALQRLLEEWKLLQEDGSSQTITFKVTFNRVLKSLEQEYNSSGLESTREELQRTRLIMENNIEQVVERNERIGLLVDKTDRLTELSNGFRGSAVRVKRSMWWQNVRFWVVICIVVVILLLIVLKIV